MKKSCTPIEPVDTHQLHKETCVIAFPEWIAEITYIGDGAKALHVNLAGLQGKLDLELFKQSQLPITVARPFLSCEAVPERCPPPRRSQAGAGLHIYHRCRLAVAGCFTDDCTEGGSFYRPKNLILKRSNWEYGNSRSANVVKSYSKAGKTSSSFCDLGGNYGCIIDVFLHGIVTRGTWPTLVAWTFNSYDMGSRSRKVPSLEGLRLKPLYLQQRAAFCVVFLRDISVGTGNRFHLLTITPCLEHST